MESDYLDRGLCGIGMIQVMNSSQEGIGMASGKNDVTIAIKWL
jgi:hypothetical protein